MAESKPVKGADLIEDGIFEDAKKQAKDLDAAIVILSKSMEELLKIQKDGLANIKKIGGATDAKSLKETQQALDEVTEARKKAVEVDKIRLEYTKKFEAQRKQELADFQKKQKAEEKALKDSEKANKQREKDIKQLAEQSRAYNVASKRLNELRKDYKDLAVAGQGGTKAAEEMLKEIKLLDAELKEVDEIVGQFNRSVGDYKNQVKDAINESDLFTKSLGGMSESNQIIIQGFSKLQGALRGLNGKLDETRSATKKVGLTLKAAGIGLLITALASVGAFFKSSREGGQEFALIMARVSATISVLVGNLSKAGKGILGLGVAVKQFFSGDFTEASETASESIDNIANAFDGTVDRIVKVSEATVQLTKDTYEFENALRKMQLTLLKSNLDEEDYNSIASDNTRTLKEQKEALNDAAKARLVSAQISAKISKTEEKQALDAAIIKLRSMQVSETELELIRKQGAERLTVSDYAAKLGEEELTALNEKVKANIEAQDALSDLPREEAKLKREQIQKETEYRIELTRSKKLAANSEVAILTKQLADEKLQLEERRVIRERLNEAENATQQNQFELFNKGIDEENKINKKGDAALKQRVDFRALVAEKDTVALAEKIRTLNLSEAQQIEVAKVVKEAQTQEIENNEFIAKQDIEELQRKEKIAQIDREILAIQKQAELDAVSSLKSESSDDLKKQNNVILQNNNVFNRKLLAERKEAFEKNQDLTAKEFELKEQQARASAVNDIINIKTDDIKTRAEEELKIKTKLKADLEKLERERAKTTTELSEDELEQQRQIAVERTDLVLKGINEVTGAFAEELDKRNELEAKQADRAISKQEQTIETQQKLAEQGKENTLAFERQKLEEQELARRDAEERNAKIQEALQLAQTFNSFLQARLKQTPPQTSIQAIAGATSDTFLAKGIAKGLVQFAADGNNMIEGAGTTTSDSIPFMLSKKEAVVKASENIKHNDAVVDLNAGVFGKNWMPKSDINKVLESNNSMANNVAQSVFIQQNNEIKDLLLKLVDKPVHQFNVDNFGNIIEGVYTNGIKKTIKHVTSKPRL
jgi:hypothetical protein